MPAIGIDLGTCMSAVAVMQNGKVHVIANSQGNRTTPSIVAFTDEERLIGESAKNQAALNPTNTIFDAKRLIGRAFNDKVVQSDMKLWPFKVVDKNNLPMIEVEYQRETKKFKPEEISAMVLSYMKETAETYLGMPVTDAVITVPAYFGDAQKQATKDAGIIAGLNVLRIISEPTAAAIAYGYDLRHDKKVGDQEKRIVVVDGGGGTWDNSLLEISLESTGDVYEVKAVSGDSHFGGEDFDQEILTYFINEFRLKHGKDINTSKRSLRRLRTACEKAKKTLSSSLIATVEIDSLFEGIDFLSTITRAKFESLCAHQFSKIVPLLQKVLEDSKMSKSQINEVVMVGGSTRIPKVLEIVTEFFKGTYINTTINPDECVAYGAAIQADILTNTGNKSTNSILLLDVAPLSLGIAEGRNQNMEKIIERQSTIPCKKSKTFSTSQDNQTTVRIDIFEGERPMVKDNHKMGSFELTGIPPGAASQTQIEVTFNLDADGILTVKAECKGNGVSKELVITNDSGKLTSAEIAKMVADAELYKADDELYREKLFVKSSCDSYLDTIEKAISKGSLSSNDQSMLEVLVKDGRVWLFDSTENKNISKSDIEEKQKEWFSIANPLISKEDIDEPMPDAHQTSSASTNVEDID